MVHATTQSYSKDVYNNLSWKPSLAFSSSVDTRPCKPAAIGASANAAAADCAVCCVATCKRKIHVRYSMLHGLAAMSIAENQHPFSSAPAETSSFPFSVAHMVRLIRSCPVLKSSLLLPRAISIGVQQDVILAASILKHQAVDVQAAC